MKERAEQLAETLVGKCSHGKLGFGRGWNGPHIQLDSVDEMVTHVRRILAEELVSFALEARQR